MHPSPECGIRATVGARARAAAEHILAASLSVTPGLGRRDALVLAFHNVVPEGEKAAGEASLHLPQRVFAEILDLLRSSHEVVPLTRLFEPARRTARPRAVLTFDDAYRGALTAGVSEMDARGMPATIFVAPGLLGGDGFWWDALTPEGTGEMPPGFRDRALQLLGGRDDRVREDAAARGVRAQALPPHARPGTEAELSRAVSSPGITLGAHGWDHRRFAALSGSDLVHELEAPLQWLRRQHPASTVPWLSYPYGDRTGETRAAAARAGYDGALRVGGGRVRAATDRMDVPRLNVPAGLSPAGFRIRAAGFLCR